MAGRDVELTSEQVAVLREFCEQANSGRALADSIDEAIAAMKSRGCRVFPADARV